MRHELLYQPSFAVVRLLLEPGESIRAESGAMVSMSPTIEMESKVAGGLGKALGRLLGGESLFQTTFTAARGPGELVLAPALIGDVAAIPLQGQAMMVTSGCFLAGDTALQMETKTSIKSFFAGEGLFLMRLSGHGTLFVSSFGALHAVDLAAGQPYIVDTGHIVAFSDTMQLEVHRAARSLIGSFTSGEGFVAHFAGPGRVYIQSRSPQGFSSWIAQFLPRSS